MTIESILWRRLDTPGHDACRLRWVAGGWKLEGAAVFGEDALVARLDYRVVIDAAWRTQRARVRGWCGREPVDFRIARTAGGDWTLHGKIVAGLVSCIDLDLGFTPATNLLPIRRLRLATGEAAEAPAAWLDVSAGALELLAQRYERLSETTYRYEAPAAGYADVLEVTHAGFVRRYPGFWEAETPPRDG